MMRLGILALATVLLAGCNATATTGASIPQSVAPSDEFFSGSKSEVLRLAVRAIQSRGWTIDQVNESFGMVSFETVISMGSWSGVKASLIIEETGKPNLFKVSGTAKQNLQGRQLVALDIGDEAKGVVRQAISEMKLLQQPKS
jgi:hypothetical protein